VTSIPENTPGRAAPASRGPIFAVGAVAVVALVALAVSLPTPAATRAPGPELAPERPAVPAGSGPPWYRELPEKERAVLPLPPGVSFGEKTGELVNSKDGSVLVWVAAGAFEMGSDGGRSDEGPAHDVKLPGFLIGKYEVTARQFAAFVAATRYVTRAERTGGSYVISGRGAATVEPGVSWRFPEDPRVPGPPDHPVVHVSWDDAVAYCAWAGLRLPSEKEWEKAARWDPRIGRSRRYAWGDDAPARGSRKVGNLADESLMRKYPEAGPWIDLGHQLRNRSAAPAIYEGYDDGFATTAPVGSFPDGASPCGALDMSGNVHEWCLEESREDGALVDSPARSEGRPVPHVIRGGSWGTSPVAMRASFRTTSFVTCDSLGFRVAR
jgi:formylglycine-generating enzyme required for sulfatase activity